MFKIFIKIIEDFFDIAIVIFLIFVILLNPYTRPKETIRRGYYSIEKREHRLLLGITGHTFLELRDENGKVLYQMHGLATDSKTGAWKEIGNIGSEYLRAWEFDGDKYKTYRDMDIGRTGTQIKIGTKIDILKDWGNIRSCALEINQKNIQYSRYGFNIFSETENSNSVAHTLIICAEMLDKNVGLFSPGSKTDLLKQ